MSETNDYKALFKSSEILSHQINMSNIENINNFLDNDKKEISKKYTINHSIHSTIDYCSLSSAVNLNFNEKYYSDSEGSKLIILPEKKKNLHVSTCFDSDTNKNHDAMHCQMPLATSSPINKINYVKDHYNSEKLQGFKQKQQKPFSQVSFNRVANIINNDRITKPTPVTIPNQNISKINSSSSEILQMELSLKMFPGKIVPYLNSLKYDVLQIINYNIPNKQMTNESKLINDMIRNSLTIMELNKNTFINNKPNKKQSTLSLINIDSNFLNLLNDNLEHINKILESAKWTLNNTEEVKKSDKDLNTLKYNDFLECRYSDNFGDLKLPELTKPDLDSINDTFSLIQPEANDSFNHIREFNKSNTLQLPSNNSIVFDEPSQDQYLENNSLKYVNEQENSEFTEFVTPDISSISIKWTLHDKNEVKKSDKDLNTLKYNDFLECRNSDNFGDLKLHELTKPNLNSINDTFSLIQPEANDSFNHIREFNKSNTLQPPSNISIVLDESSQDQCLENNSMKYVNEQENSEFTEFVTPDISLTCNNLQVESLSSKNHTRYSLRKYPKSTDHYYSPFKTPYVKKKSKTLPQSCINTIVSCESSQNQYLENNSSKYINEQANAKFTEFKTPDISSSNKDLQVKPLDSKSHGRYSLRKHPKSTDHYYYPFKPSSIKKKSKYIIKKKYKDVFVCGGMGNNKTILQYKVHSVLKANADELIKKICPKNNNDQNNATFDISNLKPKKNVKPCHCGIFPSQVPSSWNNSLHKSLHRNLHKLWFNCSITQKYIVTKKCNDNGFLYDIIKITENGDIDRKLKLTLKNVQDFINLELNYSKNNIKSNYSIFLAVNPDSKIIGYLEVELLNSACVYQNNQFSDNLIPVKFGVSKLWVMVKYRNNGVATRLLKQLCEDENLKTNDIAFSFHGSHGISFIKKFFANSSVLIY